MDWGDATSEMLSRIAKMRYATLQSTGMTQLSPEILAIRTSPATECYAIDYVLCDGHYTADVTLLRRLE